MTFKLVFIIISLTIPQIKLLKLNSVSMEKQDVLMESINAIIKPFYSLCFWFNGNDSFFDSLNNFWTSMYQNRTVIIYNNSTITDFLMQGEVFLFLEPLNTDICEIFSRKEMYLAQSQVIIILLRASGMNFKNILGCTEFLDAANVVLLFLNSYKFYVLSSPLLSPRYFVQSMFDDVRKVTNKQYSVPNLKGRLVKVATFHYPPFITIVEENNRVQYGGMEMSIFLDMAKYLNFTWQLVPMGGETWATVTPNGTVVGGVIQALREGAADIAFSNVWHRNIYVNHIVFSPPINRIYVTFMVRRPCILNSRWQSFYTIFRKEVWLMTCLAFATITAVFWLGYKIIMDHNKLGVTESIIIMFGILLSSSSHTGPRRLSLGFNSRFVVWWWFLFTVLFTTSFTGSIVTRLTLPLYSPRLDTVRQLVENDHYWVDPLYHGRETTLKEFYFNPNNTWQSKFEPKYVQLDNIDEIVDRIKTDYKITIPVQRFGNDFVKVNINGLNSTVDLTEFRVMHESTREAFTSFGLRKNSPLNEIFMNTIQWFIDYGYCDYLRRKVGDDPENRRYLITDNEIEVFSEPQKLTFHKLYPIFVLLAMGECVALLVFLIELWYKKNIEHSKKVMKNQPYPFVN